MSKFFNATTVRAVGLPLLGAAGALAAVFFPLGHKAFCAGLAGVVL